MSDPAASPTTARNPLENAIDRMAEIFGRPGKAALRLFLDALPADATINWTYSDMPQWASASITALQLQEELASD